MIQSSIRKANPKPAGNMGNTEFLFLARLVTKKDTIQAKLKGTNKYKAISHIGNSVCRLVNRVIAKMNQIYRPNDRKFNGYDLPEIIFAALLQFPHLIGETFAYFGKANYTE